MAKTKKRKPTRKRKSPSRKRKSPNRKPKRKAPKRKSKTKRKPKKKPFGGYTINFANRHTTMEEVFGKKPIAPSQMTKLLWKFVKKHRLGSIS